MGMFSRAFEKRSSTAVNGGFNWLSNILGSTTNTSSGESITNENSLKIGTVFSCAERRANTISKLPLYTYRRTGKGKEQIFKHPVVDLLEIRPHPNYTPSTFKHTLSVHVDIWGNAFVWIEADERTGHPITLWILDPTSTVIYQDLETGLLSYGAFLNNKLYTFAADEIIHLKGLSTDGIVGKSRIEVARETLGNMKATSKFIGKFYSQSTMSSGVLTYPSTLNDNAKKAIREQWRELYGGLDQAGKIAILDNGIDYKALGMPLKDAELISSMKFNKEEIAMIFNMPPHKIGVMDKTGFNNIEEQSLAYIGDSIQPVLTQFEEEFSYKLFPKGSGYFVRHDTANAKQLDSKAKAETYKIMNEMGVYTINTILDKEDMNNIGEIGDERYRSLNFVRLEDATDYQMNKAGAAVERGDFENEE